MDYDLFAEFQKNLDKNEKLIWAGQPQKGIVFRKSDFFLIPFSLLFCVFAIFWLNTAISSGLPFFFAMFGIPFVLFGLIFLFGRFFIDSKQRENIFYGLTEDRIIIKSGFFSKSIKSINIKTLSEIEYSKKKDGSGTINIGPKNPIMLLLGNGMNWWPGVNAIPSLDLINDVEIVYSQILQIQKNQMNSK